jgi:hypothetical protein
MPPIELAAAGGGGGDPVPGLIDGGATDGDEGAATGFCGSDGTGAGSILLAGTITDGAG